MSGRSPKPAYVSMASTFLLLVLVFLAYYFYKDAEIYNGYTAGGLFIAFAALPAAAWARNLLNVFLVGPYLKTVKQVLGILGWGFFTVLLLAWLFPGSWVYTARFPLLLFFLWIAVFRLVVFWLEKYLLWRVVFRTAALFPLFYIFYLFLVEIRPRGFILFSGEQAELVLGTGELAFFAWLGAVVFSLLSLLKLSSPRGLNKAGHWFNRRVFQGCLVGIVVFAYMEARPFLQEVYQVSVVFWEWIIAVVLLFYLLVYLYRQVIPASGGFSPKELARHVQKIRVVQDSDMEELSRHVGNYLEGEDRGMLISYLALEGGRAGLSVYRVRSIIEPLLNCREEPVPPLCTRREKNLLEQRNRRCREEALQQAVTILEKSLEDRGKKHWTATRFKKNAET